MKSGGCQSGATTRVRAEKSGLWDGGAGGKKTVRHTHKNRHHQAHTEAAAVVVSRGPADGTHIATCHTFTQSHHTVTELRDMLACIQVDSGYVFMVSRSTPNLFLGVKTQDYT
jgi:hypothetical protein